MRSTTAYLLEIADKKAAGSWAFDLVTLTVILCCFVCGALEAHPMADTCSTTTSAINCSIDLNASPMEASIEARTLLLEPGMTKEQVLKIFGPPNKTSLIGSLQRRLVWHYREGYKTLQIFFDSNSGRVDSWM